MQHAMLVRQLRKLSLDSASPPSAEQWAQFQERVSRTYGEADADRYRLERSILMVSNEMLGLYDALKQRAEAQAQEHARVEEILRRSEARFRSLVQNGSDVIAILDINGVLCYASPSLERILGYPPEAWIERPVLELVHPEDQEHIRRIFGRLLEEVGGSHPPIELRLRHADGSWRYVETTATNLLSDPDVRGIVQNLHDITERKRLEEQLTHQAFRDSLTGLPNRALFRERLRQATTRCNAFGERVAVVFVDLDHFKCINDSLGHDVGDRLLSAVAQRLKECVRGTDTVARLGGDEFTVLLENVRDESDIFAVVDRIWDRLQLPIHLEGHDVVITASIGVSMGDDASCGAEALVREADVAMYAAKRRGRARCEVYRPGLDCHTLERLELETELRRAIRGDELRVYFQPQIDLKSGRLSGAEALVRWQHPRRGLISPSVFIPAAEQSGLIVPLGEWVLREACRQVREWHIDRPGLELEVSVNLSARQLSQPDLVRVVAGTLEETGLDPALLQLEITESAAMDDARAAVETMRDLKALGIRLAIDDFGTGYSSLAYLKRFPVDMLKIDRSFVDGLGEDAEDTAIVHAIMAVARALGLDVTAEGVETTAQARALIDLGCDFGQGYLFAAPLTPEELERLMANPPVHLETIAAAGGSQRPLRLARGQRVARRARRGRTTPPLP